jgi:hypothetical protein
MLTCAGVIACKEVSSVVFNPFSATLQNCVNLEKKKKKRKEKRSVQVFTS